MILQSLYANYQRLLSRQEPGLSAFGYSPEKISYEIVLALDGAVVGVNNIRVTSGKKSVPRILEVPQPPKRASGIKPCFMWDKTSYVLGVSATSQRVDKEHEAFKALHRQCLSDQTDPGLRAFLAFLDAWTPERFQPPQFKGEMRDTNFVFRLDGEKAYLHEHAAAQKVWARLLGGDGEKEKSFEGLCLITGERGPLARLHPPIKGVKGKGAQSSGASIVSFNLDAFGSYGKHQGENAPISEQAAFAYTTLLNHLLRHGEDNRQRLQIGDATVVFWAEAEDAQQAQAAESLFQLLIDHRSDDAQEAEKLHRVLDDVAQGRPRPLASLDPKLDEGTRMFVLGLAPNVSRLSIRFWQADTLEVFVERMAEHERDLRIEPVPWKIPPSAWRLALATAPSREGRAKSDDVAPQLVGELMRAVLSGAHYPRSLLSNVLMRMRSDGDISGVRVALCKGVLARDQRLGVNDQQEEIPVGLDETSLNPGYRLGRLFAVLENVQRSALGGQVNATIRDRYYGAASATPAAVFPVLLRNTQNHLGRLRKDKPGLAVYLERQIGQIVDGLSDHLPRSLRIEDQGRFAIGYYHQSQARFAGKDADEADANRSESDVNANQEAA
ncbi:MAG: type I-C CRISPR-associated protein Cas8c/Csd1 [Pseudomonadales bacterium]|jgi:CRISPR-associated protein Csd1|nr:type I-C CRISPR-associated protein Cas8c/Csd1 [Pseudomonadales bacterium]